MQSDEATSLADAAAEDGFEGLSFDSYGVFPLIALSQGEFVTSENESLGTEFECLMLRSRPKYMYRTNHDFNDPNKEVVYSYDNATTVTGMPLEDHFAEWKQKGFERHPKPTRYVEVTAQLTSNNQIVLLSVAEQSVGNLSAYWAQMRMAGRDIRQMPTRVFRGKKIERARVPFYPWAFAPAA